MEGFVSELSLCTDVDKEETSHKKAKTEGVVETSERGDADAVELRVDEARPCR